MLFERYREPLARYCHSLVRTREYALDAQQNTMLSALRALRARRLNGRVRPWLSRIAHNESITVLRRRREHVELDERLPLHPDYEARIESAYADIVNSATSNRTKAHPIVGATFIQRFAGDVPWAHVDIAGVASNPGSFDEYDDGWSAQQPSSGFTSPAVGANTSSHGS